MRIHAAMQQQLESQLQLQMHPQTDALLPLRTSTASLAAGSQAANSGAPDPRLVDAAHQFEAMMLQELLKPLSFGSSPDQGDAESTGASETVRGFGSEAMAKAIAGQGGFGLARQIIRQVTAEHDAQQGNSGGTKV